MFQDQWLRFWDDIKSNKQPTQHNHQPIKIDIVTNQDRGHERSKKALAIDLSYVLYVLTVIAAPIQVPIWLFDFLTTLWSTLGKCDTKQSVSKHLENEWNHAYSVYDQEEWTNRLTDCLDYLLGFWGLLIKNFKDKKLERLQDVRCGNHLRPLKSIHLESTSHRTGFPAPGISSKWWKWNWHASSWQVKLWQKH